MKFTISRPIFAAALDSATSIVSARSPKPILQCVLLDLGDTLKVSGTDLVTSISVDVSQVQVDAKGSIAVDADKIRDIIKTLDDDTVNIEVVSDMLHVRSKDSHFKIPTCPATDFPPVLFDAGERTKMTTAAFRSLIDRVLFAAAKEDGRYSFSGALFDFGKVATCVATDGRRLAKSTCDAEMAGKPVKRVVPSNALTRVLRCLGDAETVEIGLDDSKATFVFDDTKIATVLTEGEFPPYEDVIPKDMDKTAVMGTATLVQAIRQAKLLVSEESRGCRFEFSQKGLVISSRSPENGEATVNYPCKYTGAPIEIGFNPAFVLDFLKTVDADEVTLEMTAPNRPGLWKAGKDFICVLMPVNLQ